jgi:adenosylcobinamide-phosphate synthase
MFELAVLMLLAFFLDLLIGDPPYRLHPIRLLGRWIETVEKGLRRCSLDNRAGGMILVVLASGISLGVFLLLSFAAAHVHPWAAFLFHLYVAYSGLALGDLLRHIRPVIHGLETGDLTAARHALGRVVGRDVAALDREAVVRASVETLAENFVDGFLSPLFWYTLGGITAPGLGLPPIQTALGALLLFKTASTLDSMVGYRNDRYERFGWAGARMDDGMNFLPARLSIPILFLGTCLSGLAPWRGLRTALRDRLKHDSPNAGHPESFAAGALGIRLGGPTQYRGEIKNKQWLGKSINKAEIHYISFTATLIKRSAWIAMALLLSPFFFQ